MLSGYLEGERIAKHEPNFRQLMEQAIEVMRKSINEPRNDGKASPLVGAIIYKPDATVETACRGELRYGDHAEYTLLERKNRSNSLDGSLLFSTLEPCAPGSRNPPKLSCSERIILARIKEVWVGIEDPDPTVDRKGIKYLQDSGIIVHMFDRDLQEEIREANKKFIDQAMERAEVAKEEKKPKTVILSKLENAITTADTDDLSPEALDLYRNTAKINDTVGSKSFNRRLVQQGLLKQGKDGSFVPTGLGLLLFGKEPRNVMPQAGLLGTIHYPNGEEETRDFDGPMILIPGQVEQWLKDKLPSTIDRSQMQRQEKPALPLELVREAVVNALVHRDYDIAGAKCQLVVTPDVIVVKSPGLPMSPITLEQMQSFKAPMLSRNPMMHYIFARTNLAEERGLGMKTLQQLPDKLGLPLPKYSFEEPYLILTLYRSSASLVRGLDRIVLERLNEDEKNAIQFIATKKSMTRQKLAEHLGFNERKTQRVIKKLMDENLLRSVGSGPAIEYELIQP